jgi:hypothetical protein
MLRERCYHCCLLIGGRSGMRNNHRIIFEIRFGPIRREGMVLPSGVFVFPAMQLLPSI